MAGNAQPLYSAAPRIDSAKMSTLGSGIVVGPSANTATDGSGANTYPCFVSGANGSYLQKIVFRPIGSPATTVARIFFCNNLGAFPGTWTAGTTNTAANTSLYAEITLPAWTLTQLLQSVWLELPFGFAIPTGFGVLVTFGTSTGSAGTGYDPLVIGGNY
jgi:hypothetical protein